MKKYDVVYTRTFEYKNDKEVNRFIKSIKNMISNSNVSINIIFKRI